MHCLLLSLLHPSDWAPKQENTVTGQVVARHCRAGWAGKQHGAATIFTVQGHRHRSQKAKASILIRAQARLDTASCPLVTACAGLITD